MAKLGLSIIIPCFNSGYFLEEAVESIRFQSFKYSFEIIIINDASTDAITNNILKRLSLLPEITIINFVNNKGVQQSRNAGLQAAKFRYILPLDADDKLNIDPIVLKLGSYMDRSIDLLELNNHVAFVHSMSLMFGEFHGLTISSYPVNELLILKKHHCPTSIIFRKSDAIASGGYDKSILKWQDWSFAVGLLNSRFLRNKKNDISFFEGPYHLYRIHNSTLRISEHEIDEKQMVYNTVKLYPEIFRTYYPNYTDESIAITVHQSKPSKMLDLLYVAQHNIDLAIKMITERDYFLDSNRKLGTIP